ncbi:hypothetical protein K488DRAFT_79561 [Vararia minispora EC-137]|uniref:Uncharacterized protein n=1 Tax=Vararia minispora EC-137 TaxID=1314806 RepID=A0ACB8QG03_9AGAM|nr:hypothetical protein K488DRAFT_79561 [Vararia minispora EC-137]
MVSSGIKLDGSNEGKDTASGTSVSTTFHQEFTHSGCPHDLVLVSTDAVHFYVCDEALRSLSKNNFNSLLPARSDTKLSIPQELSRISNNGFNSLLPAPFNATVPVPMTSRVLNVMLHAIYGLSPESYAPSFPDIELAITVMSTYGIFPATLVMPTSALYQIIIQQSISLPLECYALAASCQLEELAIAVSPYTLSRPLSSLTNDLLDRMGPSYLFRLTFKQLVFPPPGPHPPTEDCSVEDQRPLSRAWTLAIAYLCWDFRPGLSVPSIEGALRPLNNQLGCKVCRQYLEQRIRKLLVDWSLVKVCYVFKYSKKNSQPP